MNRNEEGGEGAGREGGRGGGGRVKEKKKNVINIECINKN